MRSVQDAGLGGRLLVHSQAVQYEVALEVVLSSLLEKLYVRQQSFADRVLQNNRITSRVVPR